MSAPLGQHFVLFGCPSTQTEAGAQKMPVNISWMNKWTNTRMNDPGCYFSAGALDKRSYFAQLVGIAIHRVVSGWICILPLVPWRPLSRQCSAIKLQEKISHWTQKYSCSYIRIHCERKGKGRHSCQHPFFFYVFWKSGVLCAVLSFSPTGWGLHRERTRVVGDLG